MEGFNIQGMTYSNSFMGTIENDNIVQQDYVGNRQVIGKTLQAYQELEQTTVEYYEKLVELGVIVPPKTAEEQNAELQQTILEMAQMMKSLKNEIEVLKDGRSKQSNKNGSKPISKRKPEPSDKPSPTDD